MLVDPDGMICQDSVKSHAGYDHADGLTTLQWIPAPEHWRIGLVESIEMQVVVNGACAVEVPPEEDAIFEIAGGKLRYFATGREDHPWNCPCRPDPARRREALVSRRYEGGPLL